MATQKNVEAHEPSGAFTQNRENQKILRASIQRWRAHNHYGRSIGRGLSQAELIDKVAGETGASKTFVRLSLRQANGSDESAASPRFSGGGARGNGID
ncbi:MAG: hypothetical protein WCU88_00695 [Elusimicrobiota bacterium]|jgi:hypothetical protein